MAVGRQVVALGERVGDTIRRTTLSVFLVAVYCMIVTPCALAWRLMLRRSLLRAHGGWVPVQEATDTPHIFHKTV